MATCDARISPTAHYTGYVWYRAGLSDPALATAGGALLYRLMRPIDVTLAVIRSASIEAMLLARHVSIDHLLSQAIENGEVGQVLEIAAGFSPRGHDFAARYHDRGLVYVEGDLPHMAQRKAAMLRRARPRPGHHHVVALDAFDEHALDRVCDRHFDPKRGTAIITEGLLMYFDADHVARLWKHLYAVLSRFEHGVYLSDLHLREDLEVLRGARLFRRLVSLFTFGRIHIQFEHEAAVRDALHEIGFADTSLRDARTIAGPLGVQVPAGVVHVLQARCSGEHVGDC